MARILGVRTGRFSLLPRPLPNGRLQLGFVETATVDWVRDALIGAAPLLAGGAFVAYAGVARLGVLNLWGYYNASGIESMVDVLPTIFEQPDFWLWFYLTLAVSSTMLPSASDRRAWLPLGLIILGLLGISLIAGAGPWLMTHLALPLNQALKAIAFVFAISIMLHLVLVFPLWGIRKIFERLFGLQVV
jgi:hypothetical protein